MRISVAARGSKLSRAQVKEVAAALVTFHPHIELDPLWVDTTGDKDLKTSLRNLERTDFFTKEIDALQLRGDCRIAIHSAKDLPHPLVKGLQIVALTKGADPSDVLVFREGEIVDSLRINAKIGTSSLRREEAIRALRADLLCVDIRGTIEHRLFLLDAKAVDGLVLAEAALLRLELKRERLVLKGNTAPYQGRLAIIAREGDKEIEELFRCLDTRRTLVYFGTDPVHYPSLEKIIHFPLIKIVAKKRSAKEIKKIFQEWPKFTHILFTSKNTVSVLLKFGCTSGHFHKQKCIAIGSVTAKQLSLANIDVAYVAQDETQEGMQALLETLSLEDAYLFFPCSSRSRPLLLEYLCKRGVRHYACAIYDTLFTENDPPCDLHSADGFVFTSPSTVEAFFHRFEKIPAGKEVIAIGPITQKSLHGRKANI